MLPRRCFEGAPRFGRDPRGEGLGLVLQIAERGSTGTLSGHGRLTPICLHYFRRMTGGMPTCKFGGDKDQRVLIQLKRGGRAIQSRFDDPEVQAIDAWRRAQPLIPNLAEAMRVLVFRGLRASPDEAEEQRAMRQSVE